MDMYTAFYRLSGRPFQLSPDPKFFFDSRSHRKAMAYLAFGLNEREGFIVITGDVGTGKTTLVGNLLNRIDRDKFVYGHVVTTLLEADDALRMVASAYGLRHAGVDKASLLRAIESFLVEARRMGKHTLLVVDEAQNIPPSALEELRMLSNFQFDGKPLLQCFLLGQPQFRRIIGHPDMEQLRQRVIASCHLEPLDPAELRDYIRHRLGMVGWTDDPSFAEGAFGRIHAHTGGVPRRVNTLCGRLLLYGSIEELHHIDEAAVEQVATELAEEGTQFSRLLDSPAAAPANGDRAREDMPVRPFPARAPPLWRPSTTNAPDRVESMAELRRRVLALKGQG
jgi:general secretion pathway protein A